MSRWRAIADAMWSAEARLRATGVLVVVAVAAGAALLVPETDYGGDLPADDALGTIAKRSYKAGRDYVVPDVEATEGLRASAMAAVRSVYDHDVGLVHETDERVAAAFAEARAAQLEALGSPPVRKGRTRKEPSDEERIEAAREGYGPFVKQLQAVIDEAEYRELARLGFSEPLEQATRALVQWAMAGEVAPGRELLFAERGSTISVRPVHALASRDEREVREVERIPDVSSVRQELARLGAGLEPGTRPGPALEADTTPQVRRSAAMLATRLVRANLAYNGLETAARKSRAAAAIKPVALQYARGEKIVGDGERIEKRHLAVFRHAREQGRMLDAVRVRAGAALFAALVSVAVFRLARRTLRGFRPTKRDFVFLASTLLGNLALLRAVVALSEALRERLPWLTNEATELLLPLTAGTMLVRTLRSGESSVVYALTFVPIAAMQLGSPTPITLGLVASAVAVDRIGRRPGSRGLWSGAVFAGVTAALAELSFAAFGGRWVGAETWLRAGLAFVGSGVLSPLIAALLAPLAEAVFGYVSETRLARLANLNHPVLKELIIRAPGTYHHSLIVGSLAEAAARRIGAHPLLARVGGYYHDLGKAESPLMFYENQKTENRLEKLAPEAATAVVQKHVSDGLAKAEVARLPRAILDVIAQHHGTRYAGGFHVRAREDAEAAGKPPPTDDAFRYAGPKPRSRETALVMLADAVEAASRGYPDATPERLRALVPRVVEPILLEGQLDDCELTLADVRHVIEALQASLVEMHGLSPVEPLHRPPSRISSPGAPADPDAIAES